MGSPCGVLARLHALHNRKSICDWFASKSSRYTDARLSIWRDCPGMKCASSASIDITEGSFVSRNGRKSTALVSHGASRSYEKFTPQIVFDTASPP